MAKRKLAICREVSLDPSLHEAAAYQAIDVFPGNAPPSPIKDAARIGVFTQKFWGARAKDLTVGFMEPTTEAMRNKVLAYANRWGEFSCARFRWTQTSPIIRISFAQPYNYYSYLGTDNLQIPANTHTMMLGGFTLRTPDSEWERVVIHEFGHCLSGDTLIDGPRDLEKYPRGIPIKDLVGTTPWVYAWKDGSLIIRKASRVWLSKRNVKTVRIKLGTGQGGRQDRHYLTPLELVGTPDHPVLLADGKTWKKLGDLVPGDRLCSLYRQKNSKRTRIQWTGCEDRVREHTFIAEQVYGPRPEGHDCHHKNERMLDQTVENLEWKDESAHVSDHFRGKKRSLEAVAATADFWRGHHHSEESRKRMSASQKKRQERESQQRAIQKNTPAVNHTVISVEPAEMQDVYDMTVPGADSFVANGIIVHNSLGCPHEQQRRAILDLLDERKTIAYYMQTQRWSEEMVRQQILVPVEEYTLMGASPADQQSIMCYQFPAKITKSGQPILGGLTLSPTDKEYFAKSYPPETPTPPTPTPTPPPVAQTEIWLVDASTGTVLKKYKAA